MTPRRHSFRSAALLVCAALLAATMSACAPEPAPTSGPTPAFATEEEAFAAAEEVYRAYIAAFNDIDLGDPLTFENLGSLTTGDYRADERKQLTELSAEGYVRSGELLLVRFAGVGTTRNSVTARTCEDVSSVVFSGPSGEPLGAADKPEKYALEVTFLLTSGALLISDARAIEDSTCA